MMWLLAAVRIGAAGMQWHQALACELNAGAPALLPQNAIPTTTPPLTPSHLLGRSSNAIPAVTPLHLNQLPNGAVKEATSPS